MATLPRITYEDKVDVKTADVDDIHKISASDMNQLKDTFNTAANAIEQNVTDTENIQQELNEAMAVIGEYKFENGNLYFKQADGTWGTGITLPGQSTVKKDTTIIGELTLSTSRVAKPTPIKTQLKDANGVIYLETSLDRSYIKSKDGTEETTAQNLIQMLVTIASSGLVTVNPKPIFDELAKFMDL